MGSEGAKLGLGVAGAVAGAYLGGPAGASLGFALGSTLGGILFPPETPDQIGPRVTDLQIQAASYGTPIPRLYGVCRLPGVVIWGLPLEERSVEEDIESGKGGGGGQNISYTYWGHLAIGFCAGPIAAFRRLWCDGKLVYDATGPMPVEKYPDELRFYLGTETQLPDSLMEAHEGAGQVPAYRGLAYLVAGVSHGFPLADFGNRYPTFTAELATVTASDDQYTLVEVAAASMGGPAIIYDADSQSVYGYRTSDQRVARIDAPTATLLYDVAVSGFTIIATGALAVDASRSRWYIPGTTGGEPANNIPILHLHTHTGALLDRTMATPTVGAPYDLTVAGDWLLVCWRFGLNGTVQGYLWQILPPEFTESLQPQWSVDILAGLVPRAAVMDRDGLTWALCSPLTTGLDTVLYRIAPDGTFTTITLTASVGQGDRLGYDPLAHALLIGSRYVPGTGADQRRVVKWDIATQSVVATSANGVYAAGDDQQSFKEGPSGASFWLLGSHVNPPAAGAQFHELDTGTLAFTRSLEPGLWGDITTDLGLVVDARRGALWTTNASAPVQQHLLPRDQPQTVPLGSIMADVYDQVGLSASAYDVTTQTQPVTGYVIRRRMAAREALLPLLTTYFVDVVERADQLVGVNRGQAVGLTIPAEDLSAHEAGQEPPAPVERTRSPDHELPMRLEVSYLEPDRDYQTGVQHAKRTITPEPTMYAGQPHTLGLDVVMDADQAKQVAMKSLYTAWVERLQVSFQVGPAYSRLEPGDVVQLNTETSSYRVRVTQTDRGASGLVSCRGVAEEMSTYVSDHHGTPTPVPPQPIYPPAHSIAVFMDTAILSDADDDPGFYLGVYSPDDGWRYAGVFKSLDGQTYRAIASFGSQLSVGTAGAPIGDHPHEYWDRTHTLRVTMITGELYSASTVDVLNGANVALYGDEQIQWQLATEVSPGVYDLSMLLRGRKGTEWACASHVAGQRFVVATPGAIVRHQAPVAELRQVRYYKAASPGQLLAQVPTQPFVNQGRGKMPLAPYRLEGERDGSDNILLTWIRRTRYSGEWVEHVDVPLNESAELYRLEVLSGPGGTVVRTIDNIPTPQTTYTEADQVLDGFTPGDPITVRVMQLSSVVGPGYPTEETV